MSNTSTPAATLALYHYDSCPYCAMTRDAIKKLALTIELRNIHQQPAHRMQLIRKGGKGQVPCLYIENVNGNSKWLYESSDIINYLKKHSEQLIKQSVSV